MLCCVATSVHWVGGLRRLAAAMRTVSPLWSAVLCLLWSVVPLLPCAAAAPAGNHAAWLPRRCKPLWNEPTELLPLLNQLTCCAPWLFSHQVGNIEDAEHCEGAIEKIKRGIVFAASLYL